MNDLTIETRAISALKPYPNNPRTHSAKQIKQIARSIAEFGFINPVLIDDQDGIIAGHGRVEAAKTLGLAEVPTVSLSHMSKAQIRAYIIADNRLAENAGWDPRLLGIEFKALSELELDLTLTGFETPEIDVIINDLIILDDEEPDPADDIPTPSKDPPVTQIGDIWQMGPHRLICGDALEEATYAALIGQSRAQMVFTDPPYNVPISGHVCGLGAQQHREFAMAAGEMTEGQFTAFLRTVFTRLAEYSAEGSMHFHCMDWRHMSEMLVAGEAVYNELKALCVWAKTNGGMGSLYRSQHELVFVFKKGTAPHINNVELGKHGRNRTNVWSYQGANSFGEQRDELALHPTVKPVALVSDALLDCSRRGGIVLEAFAGSGTTLVAAERTGRQGYGIELDPAYCDTIVRRMQTLYGLEAIHTQTGQGFDERAEAARKSLEEGDAA